MFSKGTKIQKFHFCSRINRSIDRLVWYSALPVWDGTRTTRLGPARPIACPWSSGFFFPSSPSGVIWPSDLCCKITHVVLCYSRVHLMIWSGLTRLVTGVVQRPEHIFQIMLQCQRTVTRRQARSWKLFITDAKQRSVGTDLLRRLRHSVPSHTRCPVRGRIGKIDLVAEATRHWCHHTNVQIRSKVHSCGQSFRQEQSKQLLAFQRFSSGTMHA